MIVFLGTEKQLQVWADRSGREPSEYIRPYVPADLLGITEHMDIIHMVGYPHSMKWLADMHEMVKAMNHFNDKRTSNGLQR